MDLVEEEVVHIVFCEEYGLVKYAPKHIQNIMRIILGFFGLFRGFIPARIRLLSGVFVVIWGNKI